MTQGTSPQTVVRLFERFSKLEEALLSLAILLIAALASLNIFCRSFLGFSLAFTGELIQFCIIGVCFVGLSYAASQGRHIRMTAIYDQFHQSIRRRLMGAIAAFTAVLVGTLAILACQYVYTVFQLGGIYPATRVPFWLVYAIAPVSLASTALQFAFTAIKNFSESEVYLSPTVPERREPPQDTAEREPHSAPCQNNLRQINRESSSC